jgi:hypothetical protein
MGIWVGAGLLIIGLGIRLGLHGVNMIFELNNDSSRISWANLSIVIGIPVLILLSHLASAFCIRSLDSVLSGLSAIQIDNQIHRLKEQKIWLLRNTFCVNCNRMAYACDCRYPTHVKYDKDTHTIDDHRPDALDKEK